MIDNDTFQAIITAIEDNTSIRKACKAQGVSPKCFWDGIDAKPDSWGNQYARAKEQQTENLLEDIHDLEDEMVQAVQGCDPKVANAVATAYRCKIDNLKWIASKLKPKKYGERLAVDQDTTLRVTIQDGAGQGVRV
jgi:hypothetical protein